jgi:hypothetical protein
MIINNTNSLIDCCQACSSNANCQSWTFCVLNNTCSLKSAFRVGYLNSLDFDSGFTVSPCKKKTLYLINIPNF